MGHKKSGLINRVAVLKGYLNKKIIRGHFNRAAIKWVSTVSGRNRKTISQPETRFSIVSPQGVSC